MDGVKQKAAVAGRIVVTGILKLQSPLLIASGGEQYSTRDVPDRTVLCGRDGRPYIPATSIAGVLKHFSDEENEGEIGKMLFGSQAADKDSIQSSLIFSDVVLDNAKIITRDGVCIDDYAGVAVKGKKYDFELVDRGAGGSFQLQLVVRNRHLNEAGELKEQLRQSWDWLLQKLAAGFSLGAGTAKGLGKARIDKPVVDEYWFSNREDVVAWLDPAGRKAALKHYRIANVSEEQVYRPSDCVVEADFMLNNSLLIRDYDIKARAEAEQNAEGEDVSITAVSLKSSNDYVIPGSSLKGALRKHGIYIADRLGKSSWLIDHLMGPSNEYMNLHKDEENSKWKSRFAVDEVYIHKSAVQPVTQVRNSIDRFTGGTIRSRLFGTQGIYGRDNATAQVHIKLVIEKAEEQEIGLMLFLLRDLWQGKVALGGEKSIGRGCLKGVLANIYYGGRRFTLRDDFSADDVAELAKYAQSLAEYGA